MALTAAEKTARYRERHPDRIAAYQKKRWPEYYAKHKEKIIDRVIKWQQENPDKYRAKSKRFYESNRTKVALANEKYRKQNTNKYLFARAKLRASKRGLEFNIELDDVVVPQVCPLLGIEISPWSEFQDFRPSLDRIDSTKGYIKGNVHVVSHKANRLKNNACGDELMTLAINLLKVEGKL
jgi:hypothetical protein